jgi:hypothetical protein|nr:MAG TPA: hypothetical protein [Caudoviricetes sp.]
MRKTIALRHILYCTKQYVPGDEVFISDPEFLQLLIDNESVKVEDDEENEESEESIAEVSVEEDISTEEDITEGVPNLKKDDKPIGRKSR